MKKNIILASSSPRRIEMMKAHGLEPSVRPADIEETLPGGISMEDAVMFLALKKALAVEKSAEPGSLILAADTVVYKDGILGKPKNRADAFSMLSKLRDSSHQVATGIAAVVAGRPIRQVYRDVTTVFFTDYTDEEINAYLDTDEPYDKAGAYAIQGFFSKYIDHIEGSYDNVVGFPWALVEQMIKKSEAED